MFNQDGELSAAIEVRKRFLAIEGERAREWADDRVMETIPEGKAAGQTKTRLNKTASTRRGDGEKIMHCNYNPESSGAGPFSVSSSLACRKVIRSGG